LATSEGFLCRFMIIVNADDWGRSRDETDAALSCYLKGRVSSVSAMVFMEDSHRAARLAKEVGLDVGLHLNFSVPFSGEGASSHLAKFHERIVSFLRLNKYAVLIYNPFLRKLFQSVFQAQVDEFCRLYEKSPSHFDGHQHMHLCANLLFANLIPEGAKVRRSFSFFKGEKSLINRKYREVVDRRLASKYRLTDYFFALSQQLQEDRLSRVAHLARTATVELMTHPVRPEEYHFLVSDRFLALLFSIQLSR